MMMLKKMMIFKNAKIYKIYKDINDSFTYNHLLHIHLISILYFYIN
jgi:hypothetical protein